MFCTTTAWGNSHWVLGRIDYFHWENRVILVKTDNYQVAELSLEELTGRSEEVDDRHLVWFIFTRDGILTNYKGPLGDGFQDDAITKYFPTHRADTAVVLIGKDGSIAHRSGELDISYLFDLIDSMPMRQQEMRSKK